MKFRQIGDATVPHYESSRFPLRIKDIAEESKGEIIFPHWHDDIELAYCKSGKYEYRINDDSLIIQEGDFLFINSRVMHYIRTLSDEQTRNYCIIFKPSILTGNEEITNKYLKPIYKGNPLEFLYFPRNTDLAKECAKWMELIMRAYKADHEDYELVAIAGLNMIMHLLYQEFSNRNPAIKQISDIGELEKKMISFIYEEYQNDISLNDIASSANISTHTCCDIFKHYVGISPVKYLNLFRLEMGSRLLISSKKNIQQIAWLCGFQTSAYFIKSFKDEYGLTPAKYRKSFQKDAN